MDLSRAIDVTVEYEGVSQRLLVTRLAPRVFRLEEAVLLADDPLDCGDIVEGTLVGDSLHITRRLRKTRFVRHDFILSAELIAAPALAPRHLRAGPLSKRPIPTGTHAVRVCHLR